MVEDVATTGGSVLKAIKLLKDEGVELIPLVRIGELLHGN
ncbi:MAG: Orotate phosphoribosyltransferase [Candidatus Methanoperedens nitroreducens]|uniref:Orotate phosphoribosyltransferase n=1 Tax=Candidatus Methanoperedens nitratireducens TaxID=1392998 RepID=A0A0P7ZFS5_9EURY|nr:MAG: Orotate phosphoribosyltransferase [Candidatus Methanoperedens sp. BLZ1]CAG0966764.1 hypothetical protein METP2_01140 [Methanosarcinales archaeon]